MTNKRLTEKDSVYSNDLWSGKVFGVSSSPPLKVLTERFQVALIGFSNNFTIFAKKDMETFWTYAPVVLIAVPMFLLFIWVVIKLVKLIINEFRK